jgi:hypothetical protein
LVSFIVKNITSTHSGLKVIDVYFSVPAEAVNMLKKVKQFDAQVSGTKMRKKMFIVKQAYKYSSENKQDTKHDKSPLSQLSVHF